MVSAATPDQVAGWDRFYQTGHLAVYPELFVVRCFRSLRSGGEFLREHDLSDWQMRTPGRVLDFGCGNGRHTRFLDQEGWAVRGCDVSARAVQLSGGCDLITDHLPYPDRSFGIVLAHGVFDHIPTAERPHWIAEVKRVLQPGGLLFASFLESSAHAARALGAQQDGWTEWGSHAYGETTLQSGDEAGLSQTTFGQHMIEEEFGPSFTIKSIAYDNRGTCWPTVRVVEHRLWAFMSPK